MKKLKNTGSAQLCSKGCCSQQMTDFRKSVSHWKFYRTNSTTIITDNPYSWSGVSHCTLTVSPLPSPPPSQVIYLNNAFKYTYISIQFIHLYIFTGIMIENVCQYVCVCLYVCVCVCWQIFILQICDLFFSASFLHANFASLNSRQTVCAKANLI